MTDWTTARVTPEKLAELRRLLDAATPGPWRDEMMQGDGVTLTAIVAGKPNPDDLRVVGSTLAHNDARVLIAAVNALPALLDAAAERDEIAGRLAHLLCDLTGGRMSKTSYPVPVMAQEIEQYLSECHESDLKDERDALAAKLDVAIDVAHLDRQQAWSAETFGPAEVRGHRGVLDHIRKELVEIEAEPGDVTEWADLIILAFDGAWRSGHPPADTIAAIKAKQERNEGRQWPDWRTADPDKAIEHVRALDGGAES